jgi:hypothetical protein
MAGLSAGAQLSEEGLAPAERASLDSLFRHVGPFPPAPGADRYIYVITRTGPDGSKTIEVPEHLIPAGIASAVKDKLP